MVAKKWPLARGVGVGEWYLEYMIERVEDGK